MDLLVSCLAVFLDSLLQFVVESQSIFVQFQLIIFLLHF
jgi:hypothetical protein